MDTTQKISRNARYYLAIAADNSQGELSAWLVNGDGPISRAVKELQDAKLLSGLYITEAGREYAKIWCEPSR